MMFEIELCYIVFPLASAFAYSNSCRARGNSWLHHTTQVFAEDHNWLGLEEKAIQTKINSGFYQIMNTNVSRKFSRSVEMLG